MTGAALAGLLLAMPMWANGYFAGGTSAATYRTNAYKLVFATSTTAAQTTANLPAARDKLAGVAGAAAGYFAGGSNGGLPVTSAYKLVFATNTTAAQTTANLVNARENLAGCN